MNYNNIIWLYILNWKKNQKIFWGSGIDVLFHATGPGSYRESRYNSSFPLGNCLIIIFFYTEKNILLTIMENYILNYYGSYSLCIHNTFFFIAWVFVIVKQLNHREQTKRLILNNCISEILDLNHFLKRSMVWEDL